jgi:hypothetical protein
MAVCIILVTFAVPAAAQETDSPSAGETTGPQPARQDTASVAPSTGSSSQADQLELRGWGPRLGFGLDPDQFVFGLQTDMGHFTRHLRFQPSTELGLGDNLVLWTVNLEGFYEFQTRWAKWMPYAGGGVVAMAIWPDGADFDLDAGLSAFGGLERPIGGEKRIFLELKFGLGDAPSFKVMAGLILPR